MELRAGARVHLGGPKAGKHQARVLRPLLRRLPLLQSELDEPVGPVLAV